MKTRRKLVGQTNRIFENEEQIDAYLAENPLQSIAGIMNGSNMNPHKRYSHIRGPANISEILYVKRGTFPNNALVTLFLS